MTERTWRKLVCLMGGALTATHLAWAADKAAEDATKKPAEPPKAEESTTDHTVTIGGRSISYAATAGLLLLRNKKDEPTALVGYVAYTERGGGDLSKRPVTFAYNGGPGSSSVWLHMGALGPRRVVTTDAGPTPPPPYHVVDNASSIIDKTDLVMIDPVGTGLSHAVGDAKDKDFWGVDQDIEEMSQFIKQYVSDHGRWNSPKYLLGESYGSTRSGGIIDYLETRENMAFNGVVLISVALDIEAIFAWPSNDRPYPLFLPTYAAVAAYHHALPQPHPDLEAFLREVRHFAITDYATALLQGDNLPAATRDAIAAKLHDYTGLSVDYIQKAKLRIREEQFTQELLREHQETVGRLDARFTGISFDPLAETADYDPQSAYISAAFTSAFLDYLHGELKFGKGKSYVIESDEVGGNWDWKHRMGNGFGFTPNTGLDLAHALGYNPNLHVLVLNGLYDLATPFFATESMVDHLGLSADERSRIQLKYYPAGHMMYVHQPALEHFKADIAAFIDATSHP